MHQLTFDKGLNIALDGLSQEISRRAIDEKITVSQSIEMLTKGQNIGSARILTNPDEITPRRIIGGVRKTAGTLSVTSALDPRDNSTESHANMNANQKKSMFAEKKYQSLNRDANAKLVDRILGDPPDSNAKGTAAKN